VFLEDVEVDPYLLLRSEGCDIKATYFSHSHFLRIF
jgi:hypothetical protein